MGRPHLEPLEPRQLLSVTWVNRAHGDGFVAAYGQDAVVARRVVDAAIADWNRALPAGAPDLAVRVNARNLPGPHQLARTNGSSIVLDRDAAGTHWYFDPAPAGHANFGARTGPLSLRPHDTGTVDSETDFYTAVAREVGTALGFADASNRRDPRHAADADDLMSAGLPVGTRRLISPYDLTHTRAWRVATRPAAFSATATNGLPKLAVGWTDRYPGHAYRVYRSITPGPNHAAAGATLIATTKPGVTSVVDATAADDGRTYYYFVAPVGLRAAKEARATGSRNAEAALPSVEASRGQLNVTVSWSPVAGARYYVIDLLNGLSGDNGGHPLAVVPADTTTWTDPASFDGFYRYDVRAIVSSDITGAGVTLAGTPIGFAQEPQLTPLIAAYDAPPSVPGGGTQLLWSPVRDDPFVPTAAERDNIKGGLRPTFVLYHYRVYRAPDTGVTDRAAAGATLIADHLPGAVTGGAYLDPTAAAGVSLRYWVTAIAWDGTELDLYPSVVHTSPPSTT